MIRVMLELDRHPNRRCPGFGNVGYFCHEIRSRRSKVAKAAETLEVPRPKEIKTATLLLQV